MTSVLLLHLPDNLSRHRGMKIDCVVPQALSCLVTLPTPTFKWFADSNLCSMTILSVVLYAIHILWRRQKNLSIRQSYTWTNLTMGPDSRKTSEWYPCREGRLLSWASFKQADLLVLGHIHQLIHKGKIDTPELLWKSRCRCLQVLPNILGSQTTQEDSFLGLKFCFSRTVIFLLWRVDGRSCKHLLGMNNKIPF